MENEIRPVVLCILDGWGLSARLEHNAFAAADTPVFDQLFRNHPWCSLQASGADVGLIAGQMGDSNVGHLNIGAGRIVYQSLGLINQAIQNGDFQKNEVILQMMRRAKANGKTLHLMGLLSDGGVHSHLQHLINLLAMAKQEKLSRVYVHAFLDGRDVPPQSAQDYISQLEAAMQQIGVGRIATVSGRFYAMDRDHRWERLQCYWQALAEGKGETADSAAQVVSRAYAEGITDEFILPTVINDSTPLQDGDQVFFFNYRADRARELCQVLLEPDFKGFLRCVQPKIDLASMTEYDASLHIPAAFQAVNMKNMLGEVVAKAGLRQLRLAETEKYAHVTFFFDGGVERKLSGEDRILIPSPQIATYDLQPEMSAPEITSQLVEAIHNRRHNLIVVNYANGDMVGHTGNWQAAIKAMELLDQSVEKVVAAIQAVGGSMLITSDHGNIEQMVDETTGEPYTAHTVWPVPCLLISADADLRLRNSGRLADLAPTVLSLLQIEQPEEMTGQSLLWSAKQK
ncbi:MAG: 2,3-bisphosphoglycerate-independent phosphoglycerate mutase [Negativicutes bacterium]|nr:2,3-bisphosphoglycerate-independent phosphoglycerate mutase [Negativicutes bacterium]